MDLTIGNELSGGAVGRARRTGALAVTALLMTACGSTVAGTASGAGTPQQGLSGPAVGGAAANGLGGTTGGATGPVAGGTTGGTGGLSGTSGGAAPGGTTGAAAGPNGTSTGVGGGSDASGVLQGPGVTAKTVTIGFNYTEDGTAGNKAIGANLSQGDEMNEAKAVVADINAHGGVAGRKLQVVFHAYSNQSADSGSAQDESACQDYNQDHKVFAVAGAGLSDTLPSCLAKAGVMHSASGQIISHDNAYYARYPHFADLASLTQERMMRDLAARLVAKRYFDGWNTTTGAPAAVPAKVGVLSFDRPDWERPLTSVLLPALKRAGHPVADQDVIRARYASTTTEAGPLAADMQSAALRFRNDGVTHVIFLDGSALMNIFFSQNATNQHYYPRYGVNSATGMQALVDGGVVDKKQLTGALGIGWLPGLDLPPAASGKYVTAGARHCASVMSKAGFSFPDTNSRTIAYGACDQLYFIAAAINGAGPSVTLANAQAAVDRLGSSFVPANLPAAYFSARQHDAVAKVYDLAWDDGCGCAKYTDGGHSAA
jgi:ABC-type branched-subunit amino acid transport system substrate-binding protein